MSCDAEKKRQQHGGGSNRHRIDPRIRHGKPSDGHRHRALGEQQPAAPPAKNQWRVAIHQGRPQKLERIGHARQRKPADGGQINAGVGHPGLQH